MKFFIEDLNQKLIESGENYSLLTNLLNMCIEQKKIFFKQDEIDIDFCLKNAYLTSNELTKNYINFKSAEVNYVLLHIAETKLGKPFPVNDVLDATVFAEDFFTLIRQPKNNTHWYSDLDRNFRLYAILYIDKTNSSIDWRTVLNNFRGIEHNNNFSRFFLRDFSYSIPFLKISAKEIYELLSYYTTDNDLRYYSASIDKVCEVDITKGKELLELILAANPNAHNLITSAIIGFSRSDFSFALNELEKIYAIQKNILVRTLAWMNYSDKSQICQGIALLNKLRDGIDSDTAFELSIFYSKVLGHKLLDETELNGCFEQLSSIINLIPSDKIATFVSSFGSIEGYDEYKMKIFKIMIDLGVVNNFRSGDFFRKFDDLRYFFDVMAEQIVFWNYQMISNLESIILSFSSKEKHLNQIKSILLDWISSKIGKHRYIAHMLLTSTHFYDFKEIDLLQLDEEQQEITLYTFCTAAISIDEIMPIILPLRNSPHQTIKQLLKDYLEQMVVEFGGKLIEETKSILNLQNANDSALFDFICQAMDKQKEIYKFKQSKELNEFDARFNQMEHFQLYCELEHKRQTLMQKEVNKNSLFSQIAHNIAIIRGSAFKTEASSTINFLSTVSTSMVINNSLISNPVELERLYRLKFRNL